MRITERNLRRRVRNFLCEYGFGPGTPPIEGGQARMGPHRAQYHDMRKHLLYDDNVTDVWGDGKGLVVVFIDDMAVAVGEYEQGPEVFWMENLKTQEEKSFDSVAEIVEWYADVVHPGAVGDPNADARHEY